MEAHDTKRPRPAGLGLQAQGTRLKNSQTPDSGGGNLTNDCCGELGREGRMVLVSEFEDRLVPRQSILVCEVWPGLAWAWRG